MAGTIEYLVAEILELSGLISRENNKKRIAPRHIMLAILIEFSKLFKDVVFSQGGVVPHIESVLWQTASKTNKGNGVMEAVRIVSQEY